MSEKSIGAKGKPPDKQEATVDGNAPNSKEKLGNNLNENDSGEKQSELPKISEKPKAFEKKSDSRPSMKINPSSNRNGKSKREDDKRASYPVRSPHSRGRHYEKSDSRTYQSSSFKSETKRSGRYIWFISSVLLISLSIALKKKKWYVHILPHHFKEILMKGKTRHFVTKFLKSSKIKRV